MSNLLTMLSAYLSGDDAASEALGDLLQELGQEPNEGHELLEDRLEEVALRFFEERPRRLLAWDVAAHAVAEHAEELQELASQLHRIQERDTAGQAEPKEFEELGNAGIRHWSSAHDSDDSGLETGAESNKSGRAGWSVWAASKGAIVPALRSARAAVPHAEDELQWQIERTKQWLREIIS